MEREMAEQPAVLERLAARFDNYAARVSSAVPRPLAGTTFVARGSSDHAAVFGRYLAEIVSGRPSGLAAPSIHTLYRARVDYSGYLAVAVSQSGATPEIVTVCEHLRAAGAGTVAILNDAGSNLARAVDVVLPLDAGAERAVPATKTVTGELVAMTAVAAALGGSPFTHDELTELPAHVQAVLDDPAPAEALASEWAHSDRLYVVSRGLLLAAALEAALKIKETTGILAEGMSAADLRHGPIAVVDPTVPVLLLHGDGEAGRDVKDLGRLARARGAPVAELPLPAGVPEVLAVVPAVVRAQQLALALARERGLDPDAPAGLAKVTPTT